MNVPLPFKTDVKEAVQAAKAFVADILAAEHVTNIGLEEVRLDEDQWLVTIGFSRPWNFPKKTGSVLDELQMFPRSEGKPERKRMHRIRQARTVLLDTNLLLLYLVGSCAPEWILRHKRTASYRLEEFKPLCEILSRGRNLVVTPNILTETSNLARQIGDPKRRSEIMKQLAMISEENA